MSSNPTTHDERRHPLRIERCHPGDAFAAIEVLEDATRWLRDRGIDQWWPEMFPRETARAAERDELYVAFVGPELAGTLCLSWSDERIWPGANHAVAAYVHRLAVRRLHAGRHLGLRLLDWAAGEAADRGRTLLRLDCMRDNARLRGYYVDAGFTYCGDVTGTTRAGFMWASSRYQRSATELTRVRSQAVGT